MIVAFRLIQNLRQRNGRKTSDLMWILFLTSYLFILMGDLDFSLASTAVILVVCLLSYSTFSILI